MSLLDGLVFFPDRDVPATPPAGIEERTFTASDGVRLHAWAAGPADAPATLLWSHGNGGNISHRLGLLELLHALPASVLLVDYRGYGLSEGRPSERGTYLDAEAAWRHLTEERGFRPAEIVVHGHSL